MNGWKLSLYLLFLSGAFLNILVIGKPRKPILPMAAAMNMVGSLIFMYVVYRS